MMCGRLHARDFPRAVGDVEDVDNIRSVLRVVEVRPTARNTANSQRTEPRKKTKISSRCDSKLPAGKQGAIFALADDSTWFKGRRRRENERS